MSESPQRKRGLFAEHRLNRKSKSPLKTRGLSPKATTNPLAPRSPIRSIRKRIMQYEANQGSLEDSSVLSNTILFPEPNEDCKENNFARSMSEDNNSYSPLTLDTDIPIHPLQFPLKEVDESGEHSPGTPSSGCKSLPTPSPTGGQRPQLMNTTDVSFGHDSPDSSFLGTPTSKYQSLSDTKIKKKHHSCVRKINSPFKIVAAISPKFNSKPGSKKNNFSGDESSDSTYLLGALGERLDVPEFNNDNGPETTILFQNSSHICGDPEENSARILNTNENANMGSIKRNKRRDDFVQIMSRSRPPSELHSLCSCMTTKGDLIRAKSFLFGIPLHQASRRNYNGETILHAFSNNKALATIIGNPNNDHYETKDFLTLFRQPSIDKNSTDQLNKLVERFLVDELLPSFFGAPIAHDNSEQIPFEAGLIDWVATCHKEMYGISPEPDLGYFSAYSHRVSDAVSQAWESTSTTLRSAIPFANRSASKMTKRQRQDQSHRDIERGDSMSSSGSTTSRSIGKCKFTPHARFCLRMLSLILDEFDKFTEGFKHMGMNHQIEQYGRAIKGIQQLENVTGPLDLCGRVVEKIASIPNLLEVVFSINNDLDLEFVLSTKIIKRVLIDKRSVGPWLTNMLQSPQRHISQRAILYLQRVSNLCTGSQQGNSNNGKDQSHSEQIDYEDLIDEVSRLNDFIPSLLALGDNVIEEVSTTLIVQKVMDRMIARPFVATVVFFDAIFLFLTVVGFRAAVNGMIMGDDLDTVLVWIYVANTGIFYFIIGEIGKFVSLFLLSKHSRNYILSFWNLADFLAILFAAISSITMRWQFTIGDETGIEDNDALRGLLAVTTGFLYLRVLNFLKAINMQLATFVLAILQITKDIFWFCIIVLTLVIAFSQMFFTLLAPPSCSTKELSGRQCKQSEYLLGVYSILLGDFGIFSRDDFSTSFSVFLLVLYTFLVTVVLLNVLIAIASDSYEKCLLKSQKLFGRARVMLIAQLASFQSLLRRMDQDADSSESLAGEGIVYNKWWTSAGLTHNWSRGSALFFGLSMLVMVCWTFAELVGYVEGVQVGSLVMSFSSVVINIILYIIIMFFLDRNSAINSATNDESADGGYGWAVSLQKTVHWVLGVSRRSKEVSSKFSRGQDVWHGRVEFLQRKMDGNAERQTELLKAQSESLQNCMNMSETRVMTEINQIDDSFKLLEATVQDELKGTREINANLLSAVKQLRLLISLAEASSIGNNSSPNIPTEVDVTRV